MTDNQEQWVNLYNKIQSPFYLNAMLTLEEDKSLPRELVFLIVQDVVHLSFTGRMKLWLEEWTKINAYLTQTMDDLVTKVRAIEGMEDLADELSERFPCELDPDNAVATALQALIDTTEARKVGDNLKALEKALNAVKEFMDDNEELMNHIESNPFVTFSLTNLRNFVEKTGEAL